MANLRDALVGHETQWNSLVDMAEKNHLPGAMGFVGPGGVGKKHLALAYAQYLCCPDKAEKKACGVCGSCLRIEQGQSESLILMEAAGEQFKVEQIQNLKSQLSLQALRTHRLVVIDEADRLNPQSANALLKLIEEPPERTHFILVTSSLSSLLPTIRSRLMTVRFFKLSFAELKKLSSGEDWVLRLSRGRLGDIERWASEDSKELTGIVNQALLALKERSLDRWLDSASQFKERDLAIKTAKMFQFYFKDQILLQLGEDQDVVLPISKEMRWPINDVYTLTAGWKKASEIERKISQNSDRTLLFVNYFYEVAP